MIESIESSVFAEIKSSFLASIESSVFADLENGKGGAEHSVLSVLAKFVLHGIEVSPKFQRVANLIITKSMLENRLPRKKNGRPKDHTGIDGELVASTYSELTDGGSSYADAVSKLAAEFHKDERQIMRIVKENKKIVSAKKYMCNLSEHFPNNEVANAASDLGRGMEEYRKHQRKRIDPQSNLDTDRKLIARLDKQILAVLSGGKSTDINPPALIASD